MFKLIAILVFVTVLYATPVFAQDFTYNFIPRTIAPCEDDPRFTTSNPFYNVGLGLPNCTAYAWGRAYEILGQRPNLNVGSARYWFYNDGGHPSPYDTFPRGQEPRLGAIAVWGRSVPNYYGHVAVVEYVHADGTIDLSESSWGGERFIFSQNVDIRCDGAWRAEPVCRNFLGFIYLCGFVYTAYMEEPPIIPGTYYPDYYEPDAPQEDSPTPVTDVRILRFTIDSTIFTDNGLPLTIEAAPFIENGRTMVPLRAIGEALGATNLSFNAGVITFDLGGRTIVMIVDEPLDNNMGTPVIVAGRTFVPLAYIIDVMGAEALWDGNARAVYIYIANV